MYTRRTNHQDYAVFNTPKIPRYARQFLGDPLFILRKRESKALPLKWLRTRAISTLRLNALPRLHLEPIKVVISDRPNNEC